MLISNFKYRPEIDGLRALAVLAVVCYHAGFGVTGGFVGVDVFFVISGYLITSLIVKDLEAGKFSMRDFWARRARRILPALFVVVIVTLAVGWVVLLPSDFQELGQSAAWQSVFSANFFFWWNTGYFGGPAVEKPLLHTWSLAVEEQFYLVIPLILLGVFHFTWTRKRGSLLGLIGTGVVLSLIASVVVVVVRPSAAFYLLPTRAWELLFGSFVALLPPSIRQGGWKDGLMCWVGLALIVVPCFAYTEQTSFPGLAAVPPCLGSALLIRFGSQDHDGKKSIVARMSSARPLVFIGLISYSFYLWHWPLLAYGHYLCPFREVSLPYRIGLVALSFGLAILSWKFVETPFRLRRFCHSNGRILSFGAVGLATIFLSGVTISLLNGVPNRWSEVALKIDQAQSHKGFRSELTPDDLKQGKVPRIGVRNDNASISVVVWGDSHAMAAVPAIDAWLEENQLSGSAVTRSSTAPLVGYSRANKWHTIPNEEFSESALRYIESSGASVVILVAMWEGHSGSKLGGASGLFEAALVRTVDSLKKMGIDPWIVTSLPMQPIDVPKALMLSERFGWNYKPFLARPDGSNGLGGNSKTFIEKLRDRGAKIIDPRKSCLSSDGSYEIELNTVILHRDFHHFTPDGARKVLLPLLRACNAELQGSLFPAGE